MNEIEYAKLKIECDRCSPERVYTDLGVEKIHKCEHCTIGKLIEEYENDDGRGYETNKECDES